MSEPFLKIDHVTKAYAGKLAVNDVTLDIPKGKIFGLLGPNGAGKTSIIRMITSITRPDKGEIYFDGRPLEDDHNRHIGYMPEERGLYKKMKVLEQLTYLLRLRGLKAKDAKNLAWSWMVEMDITDWANKKVTDLSKGMQQKVQFIATVAHKPSLLILDEPFSGLDPINSQIIEDKIRQLKAEGTTLIFSTHRLEQVEELCDNIGLINNGQMILEGEVDEVRKRFQKDLFLVKYSRGAANEFAKIPGVNVVDEKPGQVLLGYPHIESGKLLRELGNLDVEVTSFSLKVPKLQEIFIESVQKSQPK